MASGSEDLPRATADDDFEIVSEEERDEEEEEELAAGVVDDLLELARDGDVEAQAELGKHGLWGCRS
jgi:hypothetical protein